MQTRTSNTFSVHISAVAIAGKIQKNPSFDIWLNVTHSASLQLQRTPRIMCSYVSSRPGEERTTRHSRGVSLWPVSAPGQPNKPPIKVTRENTATQARAAALWASNLNSTANGGKHCETHNHKSQTSNIMWQTECKHNKRRNRFPLKTRAGLGSAGFRPLLRN